MRAGYRGLVDDLPGVYCRTCAEKRRGLLGTLFQLGIVVGIFLTLFINKTIQDFAALKAVRNETQEILDDNRDLAVTVVKEETGKEADAAELTVEEKNAAVADAIKKMADPNLARKTLQAALARKWNISVGWRWMLGVGALPALLFFVLLLGVPESPRWLTQNGREAEARQILARAAGAHANEQMAEIRKAIGQEEGRFSELFSGAISVRWYWPSCSWHARSCAASTPSFTTRRTSSRRPTLPTPLRFPRRLG